MRFQFSLVYGQSAAERGGRELEDAVQASEVADDLARQLARARPALAGKGCVIVVKDDRGEEVYRATLAGTLH